TQAEHLANKFPGVNSLFIWWRECTIDELQFVCHLIRAMGPRLTNLKVWNEGRERPPEKTATEPHYEQLFEVINNSLLSLRHLTLFIRHFSMSCFIQQLDM